MYIKNAFYHNEIPLLSQTSIAYSDVNINSGMDAGKMNTE